MKNFVLFSMPFIALGLFGCTSVEAQYVCEQPNSMWERRRPDSVFLFRDTSARQVGDLVTILVQESTDVGNRDQRAMGKDSDARFQFDFASQGNNSAAGSLDIGGNSDRNYNGSSSYSSDRQFIDRMTVRVTLVEPNGNLVINGKRRQLIAGEIRTLCVSGVIRSVDVGPGNVIRSRDIADLNICYDGDGPESHFVNQNWGGRIINKLWPF